MSATLRLGSNGGELVDTATIDSDTARFTALDDNGVTVSGGGFTFTIAGRNVDDAIIASLLPFTFDVYRQAGLEFTDANLFVVRADSLDDELAASLDRINDGASASSDPLAFAQAEFDALATRIGLRIDFDRFIEVGDTLEAAGLSLDSANLFEDAAVYRALDIAPVRRAEGNAEVDSIVVREGGAIVATLTGEGLDRVLDSSSIDDLLDGDDLIVGTAAADTLDGSTGADRLVGGDGNDRYLVDDAGDQVVENPGGGIDRVDLTSNFEYTAPDNVEVVVLGDGVIAARPSAAGTKLAGLDDDNLFYSGPGTDFFDGNSGVDTLTYENAEAGISASLLKPTAFNTGGAGTDKIDDIENLTGSRFDDVLVGAQGVSNIIDGGDGDDIIVGFAGPDELIGGSGADTFLYNSIGFRDSLIGGGEDVIVDFETGRDVVDLTRLRVGSDDITLTRGRLEADVDGDNVADFAISFANNARFNLDDIVGLSDVST